MFQKKLGEAEDKTEENQTEKDQIWKDFYEVFKQHNRFQPLSETFKDSITAFKCSTKYKQLVTRYEDAWDYVYMAAHQGIKVKHDWCHYIAMRRLMLTDPFFHLSYTVEVGWGMTITRSSRTGEVTQETTDPEGTKTFKVLIEGLPEESS